ncbi:poly(A)-specific ribonuclease PNLDC1-like [Montipora capricornis]|uniref:poly(A)-specific ribonuclease PNLDC1-like n=1 Tax=Montipora capricornis TaxID=246305 RepID=UPI0035F1BA1E
MVEVVWNNFEDLFPEIKSVIEKSVFVAIDTEFTGLYTTDASQPSLFDDPETRYKKLKKTASQFLISQFGLTAFVQLEEDPNKYIAHAFNFFLYPHSFGPIDCRFLSQASSLEFLCQHNFDFNKFIYSGVPYLNEDQATLLCKYHQNGDLYTSFQSQTLRIIDENIVDSCANLEEWLLSAQDGDEIELRPGSCQAQYLFLEELKRRFTGIKCRVLNQSKLTVTKLPTVNGCKPDVNSDHLSQEQEKTLQAMVGFSRIFHVLTACKKPLVGHNVLTDLMLTYEKFYKPLPESFKDFKLEISKLFPLIYDTKFIAFEMRKNPALSQCNFFDDTNLEKLHAALSSNDAQFFALFAPSIPLDEKCFRYLEEKLSHEAGYDSFLSGFVFLRMAHILAFKSSKRRIEGPVPFSKFLRVLKQFENLVQLSRATVQHVNLSGPDPPSIRPQWLYVSSKLKSKPLVARTLAQEFAAFGSVDVKILDSQHALVAVAQHRKAKDVLQSFRRHKLLNVRPYNSFLDSSELKVACWCCGTALVLSGAAIFLWKSLR